MSEMDDLDEDELTVFSWWNALEAGATSIDPVDALDYQPIHSWEPFDNGIQGELTDSIDGHTIRFRVRTDGWVVCWIEADSEIDVERVLLNYDEMGGPELLPANRLEDHIGNIRSELGNPGSYSPEDTGLFCYDYEEATEIGVWSVSEDLDGDEAELSETASLSLTDKVDVSHITGHGFVHGSGGSVESTVSFNGSEIVNTDDDGSAWGRIGISDSIGLDNYVFYDMTAEISSDSPNGTIGEAVGTILAFYTTIE